MANEGILVIKSLKELVYEYLRDQMRSGDLLPGPMIDMNETAERLGVSKTPLRDALIQLDMEGFVSILPRRGVIVNPLTLKDIQQYYEMTAPWRAPRCCSVFPLLTTRKSGLWKSTPTKWKRRSKPAILPFIMRRT